MGRGDSISSGLGLNATGSKLNVVPIALAMSYSSAGWKSAVKLGISGVLKGNSLSGVSGYLGGMEVDSVTDVSGINILEMVATILGDSGEMNSVLVDSAWVISGVVEIGITFFSIDSVDKAGCMK